MDAPTTALIDQIASRLAGCGATRFGRDALAENDAPPRYVWVPVADSFNPPSYLDTPVDDGGDIESVFGSIDSTFAVHVWAIDYATAWRMRAALATAIRDVVGAGSYKIGGATWVSVDPDRHGVAVTQTVTILTPLLVQQLPETLGDEIVDAKSPVTRADKITRLTARVQTTPLDE